VGRNGFAGVNPVLSGESGAPDWAMAQIPAHQVSPSSEEASTTVNGETARNGSETAPKQLPRPVLLHEKITRAIIDVFYIVYNKLGFGFLETVYCNALALELRRRGHKVDREVVVPVLYDGRKIANYRIDFVVDDVVVVEVKSTELLNPNAHRQLVNGLHATPLEVGLLLHFGPRPKHYRVIAPNSRCL
jgi:GxxExxY protein